MVGDRKHPSCRSDCHEHTHTGWLQGHFSLQLDRVTAIVQKPIVSAILCEIQAAVGVVEQPAVGKVRRRRGSLQRRAIGIVGVRCCTRRAGEHAAHRADLVDAVVQRLRRRAGQVLALVIVAADRRVAGVARLADAVAAPEVRRDGGGPAARRRAADGRPAAEAVVGEGGRLAADAGVRDADQPVLGVPGVGALAVGGEVAVGVEGQRLAGEVGELVESVVGRGLAAGGGIDGRGVAALGDAGDEVLGARGVGEVGELASGEAGVGDAGEPSVAGVAEVAPGGGEGGAGELAARDLAGLAEVAEGEAAEVVGMDREPADRVVLEGLGAGALDGARAQPAELVIGRARACGPRNRAPGPGRRPCS